MSVLEFMTHRDFMINVYTQSSNYDLKKIKQIACTANMHI